MTTNAVVLNVNANENANSEIRMDLSIIEALIKANEEQKLLEISRYDADSVGEPIIPGVTILTGTKYCHFRAIRAPKNATDYSGVYEAWKQAFVILGSIQKYTLNMKRSGNYKSPLTGLSKAQIVIRDFEGNLVLDTRKFDTSVSKLTLFPKNKDLEASNKPQKVRVICEGHARAQLRAFGAHTYVKAVLNA